MAEDTSQIREAIEGTRADIAETMGALGQKADVKGRLGAEAKEKAGDLKTAARTSAEHLKTKLGSVQEQARAALPDSAHPAPDAALARIPGSGTADQQRTRVVAVAAGVLVLMLLRRRRRRRR